MDANLNPRFYQLWILDHALKMNTLAYLPTGSGKTLISVLLIKHYLNLIRSTSNNTVTESVKSVESPRIVAEDTNAITRFDGGGFEKDCSNPPNPPPSKRVIAFVAPTKILVDQQRTYIAGNCNAVVRAYTSETVASLRDWAKQLAEVDVFVLTPEILRNALERKMLKVSSFALVILDECHNAMGKNPMSIVCELIKASEVRPRLLGLTASPIICKKGDIAALIADLETTTGAKLLTIMPSMAAELKEAVPLPESILLRYNDVESTPFGIKTSDLLGNGISLTAHAVVYSPLIVPTHAAHVLLHAVLRLRHANYIYSIYKLGNTLQMSPNDIEDFECLHLPNDCEMSEGFLLDELLSLVAQVMRVAEDCGLLGGLYSLRESIYPTSPGSRFNFFSSNPEGSVLKKRKFGQVLDHHLLDIDVERLLLMKDEVVQGPFKQGLYNFRRMAVSSLLDCFVVLISIHSPEVLSSAAKSFKARAITKSTRQKVIARDLVHDAMVRTAAGTVFTIELGSTGCLDALLPNPDELLPLTGQLCKAVAFACDSILAALAKVPMSLTCDISVEKVLPESIPSINELDVDPFPALFDFYAKSGDASYSLISPKVKALCTYLVNSISSEGVCPEVSQQWACVVFCRMRLTTLFLRYILSLFVAQGGADAERTLLAGSIVGMSKQPEQFRTLMRFKAGKFNVLFATDVAEEGLDIRCCQLVVNFDMPMTVKSMIQRRGRARAFNSTVVTLVPISIEGNCMIRDIAALHKQEEELEQHVKDNISSLTVGDMGDDNTDDFDPNLAYFNPEYSYMVPSTGVTVDVRSAGQLLLRYCQKLPHDVYFNPQPIFWCDRMDNTLFRSSVLLPSAAPDTCRCAMSPFVNNLKLAKGIVALRCLKRLHEYGEVDDFLLSKCKHSISDQKKDDDNELHSEVGVAPLEIKVVADAICGDSFTEGFGVMHMYAAKVKCSSDNEESVLCSCLGCGPLYNAFKDFGFAFPSVLPDDVLGNGITLTLRSTHTLRTQICYLGCRQLNDSELNSFQRFHRATCCWEADGTMSTELGTTSCDESTSSSIPLSMEAWTRSSNGACYMIFPLHPLDSLSGSKDKNDLYVAPVDWDKFLSDSAHEAQQLIHNIIKQKIEYEKEIEANALMQVSIVVKDVAEETVPIVTTNEVSMQVEDDEDSSKPLRTKFTFRGKHTAADLEGVLVSAHPYKIYVGMPSTETCSLHSVLDKAVDPNKTFFEYYTSENLAALDILKELYEDSTHTLLTALPVSGKMDATSMLLPATKGKNLEHAKPHRHSITSHLIPEFCSPLGKAKYYYIGMTAPCLVWRLQSLFLAQEAATHTKRLYKEWQVANHQDVETHHTEVVLGAHLMLTAITPRMTLENINSERYEMIGDSFLKFIVSVELFKRYPDMNEGRLTTTRVDFISNQVQTASAKRLNLDKYIRALPLIGGRVGLNFEPPGRVQSCANLWSNFAVLFDVENLPSAKRPLHKAERRHAEVTRRQHYMASVRAKVLADFIESTIGACFSEGGVPSAIAAVKALGCWPTITLVQSQIPEEDGIVDKDEVAMDVPTPIERLSVPENYPPFLQRIANLQFASADPTSTDLDMWGESTPVYVSALVVDDLERLLGYRFVNMDILEEAVTHCSIPYRRSNQRMEFLGDAVLDFAVVTILCEQYEFANEGELTTLKSEYTNNMNLGIKAISLGLQKYLNVMSAHLVNDFKDIQLACEIGRGEMPTSSTTEPTDELPFDPEAVGAGCVKSLADFLEALFGAIFLDCGESLDVACKVVNHIRLIPPSRADTLKK